MSRKSTILYLALALLWLPAVATAQIPLISQISPQPTSAGTPTSSIVITGSNFGQPTDQVRFPGNPAQYVSPTSWASGYLVVPVPSTWSGTISVFSNAPSPDEPFLVSYNWGGKKWFNPQMTWFLNQNGAPGVPIASVIGAVTWSYNAWECNSGFTPNYGGLTVLDGANHNDGNNVQYWGTVPWANPNLIAVATYTYNPTTFEIIEADIHYNGADWSWSAGGSATTVDIQHVAAHESGHTLGLHDLYGNADNLKTMYGLTNVDQTRFRDLEPADLHGAEYLYPRPGRGNLREGTPSGWWGPIVPRDTPDATGSYAPLPATLPGYTGIYASFGSTNDGLDCLAPGSRDYVYLDGQSFNNGGWNGSLIPGALATLRNQPVTVPGGRHTLRIDFDNNNELFESNENDNTYKSQFAWSPFGLADQHPEVRPAPPEAGTLVYPNCEGFMFTGNWWGAVAATPTNASDDYDLRLFDDYSGSTTGYQTVEASSVNGSDRTDIVLVNGNIVGSGELRWAGTVRYNALVGANVVVQQSNQVGPTYYPGYLYGSSATTGTRILAANQIFKVHEFYLADTAVTYEFDLMISAGAADLNVAVFDAQVDYHGLGDAVASATTINYGGGEVLFYKPPATGYYGVAIYKAGSADLPIVSNYELICRVAPPNLDATDVPGGHDEPLVPRNVTGATAGNVHLTTFLNGNSPTTYLNFSVEQEGPNSSPQWLTTVSLDWDPVLDAAWSGEPVPAATSVQWFDRGPFEVRGGRHTLGLFADPDHDVAEALESDNIWEKQFVWSPLPLTMETPVLRDVPPSDYVQPYFSCDGMNYNRDGVSAWVVGMTPFDAADDYDLFVYEDYVDSQDGFDDYFAYAAELLGDTDYIVGHYSGTPLNVIAGVMDAGSTGNLPFAMEATDARNRQGGPEAEYLFQLMDPFRMVDVYEAFLTAGQPILFRLEQYGGVSDLKLRIFPGTPGGMYDALGALGTATVFSGNEQWMVFEAPEDAWYPLVVSRPDYRGLDQPVEYSLTWAPTAISGVEEESSKPTQLMFMAPSPNPTSSGSSLDFALPASGRVRIDVFDLRGNRIQTVVDREFPTGRHQARWTGRDGQGRQAATGVYYARLQFHGKTLTRRMTVLR